MKINEMFYSLQGEGRRAGEASVFIRLTGCDLACGFCDTEFESGKEMLPEEILETARAIAPGCRWLVWTGGEPMLQLTEATTEFFRRHCYSQAIETNGNHPVPKSFKLDWVCVSPKVAEHVLAVNFPEGVDELRYVRHANHMAVPKPRIGAKHFYLSPQFKGNQPDPAAIDRCVQLCLENPDWKLSVQTHKLLKIL